jgi:DNA-binding LytR/AlgR family response regulator
LRVLVVDDEQLARARLIRMLEKIPDVQVVGEADSGTTALAQIAKLKPEVVMLDVEMPGFDGLALAEKPGLPPIVFTTAHVQFAADAFDLDAVDFLVKPVRQERLEKALEKVRRRGARPAASEPASPKHQLTVHSAGDVRFVDARKVCAFRAIDKYTEFTLDGEELLVRESLDTLEERLAELGFFRVHRSGLVRVDAVTGLESSDDGLKVRLRDGAAVEVSRRQSAELKRLLGLRK